MAKRSTTSTSDEHQSPKLVIPREDAERLIQEQLDKLDVIAANLDTVHSEANFDNVSDSYRTWESFVKEMLRRIFDTEEIAKEFVGMAGGFVGQTLGDQIRSRKIDIRFSRQRLTSIKERLALIPEAQSVERMVENRAEAVWSKIEIILIRFHQVARQLRRRHDNRPTLDIDDEYDVQDLLHALLRLFFDDIREEEWTPSYAGRASRVDFLLKAEKTTIEVKKARRSLSVKEIGDQLIIDIAHYQVHPDCESLACFVYDPDGYIRNATGLENDLSGRHGNLLVKVYVMPKG